jgi:hypothetical protein
MKELSIEGKAKAYDEAIEKAKAEYEDDDRRFRATLERIFPELKESEDERIRKGIIKYLEQSHFGEEPYSIDDDIVRDYITWLEKQAEQKLQIEKLPFEMKTIGESLGFTTHEECDKYNQMVTDIIMSADDNGEQKPVKEVEPKFKVGDWVVTDMNNIVQIKAVNNGYYTVDNGSDFNMYYVDKCWHLWTIQDVKNGDILSVEPVEGYLSPFIAIYKERGLDFFNSYCFIGFDGKFYEADAGHSIEKVHPATKEQRNTLMKAMADAGYIWDSKSKRLLSLKAGLNYTQKILLGVKRMKI